MRVKKIYGPPGTGKTRTLLDTFEQLLRARVRPDRVALLTFTRAARDEAAGRVQLPLAELPWLRTIHSMCYRALGVTRDRIVSARLLRDLSRRIGVHFMGNIRDPWFTIAEDDERELVRTSADDMILQAWHLARHRVVDVSELLPADVQLRHARWLIKAYEAWKMSNGLFDYTDLLTEYLARGPLLDIDHAIVDEAQDLSWLQWQVMRRAASRASQLTVAGDDDQAIFTWAGARSELLRELEADETVVLPQSYRLPRLIHALAGRIISSVPRRAAKEFAPRDADGEVRRAGFDVLTADVVGPTFVLFRNHHRGVQLANQLDERGIIFTGAGAALSAPHVAAALAAWSVLALDRLVDRGAARDVVELLHRDWLIPGAAELVHEAGGLLPWRAFLMRRPSVENWREALTRLPRRQYLTRFTLAQLLAPRVRLLSIHQAKGREADTVILDPTMARRSFEHLWTADGDEHRVWYVAVTRARERLVILAAADAARYPIP